VREYRAVVWRAGDADCTGTRVTLLAEDGTNAVAALKAEHGEDAIITVWNETDAEAPRLMTTADHPPWCRGEIVDGPDAGRQVYAVRKVGSEVHTERAVYVVFDAEPVVARLRLSDAGDNQP
jgi:hypothetical protein